jgi:hypothetical protein
MVMGEPAWLPMALAPRDRRTTVRVERWIAGHELVRTLC